MNGTGSTSNQHRLRIIFDGVIAIGPPHPEEGDGIGPLFGVMARSTRRMSDRSRRLNETPARYIPMHVPTIYTRQAPSADSRPPDQIFQLSKFHPAWYMWHPVRERMEFRLDGSGTPGKLAYDRDGSQGVPSGDADGIHLQSLTEPPVSVRSINQVPDARKIWPERSVLKDGMLRAETPVPEEVAAQVFVPWGTVSGGGLFEKGKGVDVEFSPALTRAEPATIVPNVIVSVDAGLVEIVMYSLDTGEQLDSVKFQLSSDADVWVSNGDPSDTAVDMEGLSIAVARAQFDLDDFPGLASFRHDFQQAFGVDGDAPALRRLFKVMTGGGSAIAGALVRADYSRTSDVDIDFELFYTLLEGAHSSVGLPVPKRADGQNMLGPNCFVKLVQSRERPHMKSNG